VSCSTDNYGCDGGWQEVAFAYYESAFAELESVYPYVSGADGVVPACTYSKASATAVDVSIYFAITKNNVL